jgi:hypothetical protein
MNPLERFVEALAADGRAVASDGSLPALLRVGERELYVYAWRLTGHGDPSGRSRAELRIVMHRADPGPLRWDGFTPPLLLGYDEDRDIFAAWQADVRRHPALNASAYAPSAVIDGAWTDGFAATIGTARPNRESERRAALTEVIVAFTPERACKYLSVMDDLRRLRELTSEAPDMAAALRLQLRDEGLRFVGLPPRRRGPRAGRGHEWLWRPVEEDVDRLLPPSEQGRLQEVFDGFIRPPSPAGGLREDGEPRPPRVVSTGFLAGDYGELSRWRALEPGADYWFWLEIGPPVAESIELTPVDVEGVEAGARLSVVVSGFPGELEVHESMDTGVLELGERRASVVRAPLDLDGRMAFPVRSPPRQGPARLRCNLYRDGVLVQSRLVVAHVGDELRPEGPALTSELEYALSRQLDPAGLERLPSADLSISINGNEATHQIRFFAPNGERKADVTLSDPELQGIIDACRDTLREVAWNTPAEWEEGIPTNYDTLPSKATREKHLIMLATIGYREYAHLSKRLAENKDPIRLPTLIKPPQRIELAADPKQFLPAAVLYDHPIETGGTAGIESCEVFAGWLHSGAPREDSQCLMGDCPHHDDTQIMCPAGFWGFRHELGWPLSDELETQGALNCDERPEIGVGIATDLRLRDEHETELRDCFQHLDLTETRQGFFEMLQRRDDQVVYLYCHGGMTSMQAAFVRVGPETEKKITAAELFTLSQSLGALENERPLVFLNGCRTGALSPRSRFDLVSGFIKDVGAAGVIATEITVFEPMASIFATTFLKAFLSDEMTVGQAIRHARLELLRAGNPLGLAYIPFVLGGTRLNRRGDPPALLREELTETPPGEPASAREPVFAGELVPAGEIMWAGEQVAAEPLAGCEPPSDGELSTAGP